MARRLSLCIACVLWLSGCQYYRVEDTYTGRQYITSNWQMYEDPWRDVLELRDARTGQDAVLQEHYLIEQLPEFEAIHDLREP